MTAFADITGQLERQAIELPSWAFGNSGTRFKVFTRPGGPRGADDSVPRLCGVRQPGREQQRVVEPAQLQHHQGQRNVRLVEHDVVVRLAMEPR